jgi:hypothetical protein
MYVDRMAFRVELLLVRLMYYVLHTSQFYFE